MTAGSGLHAQPGTVGSQQKISSTQGGFGGMLDNAEEFGVSVASLGDLDNDGVVDIAVGAHQADDGGTNRGAVWVLFLNADGTVRDHQKISSTEGGFTGALDNLDRFGASVSGLGDLDGDGVEDLAVGADRDDDGGLDRGAIWILFLKADGTVKSHQKISSTQGGFTGTLDDEDEIGRALACLGDMDGDGVEDIGVGTAHDDDGGQNYGAVWILFMNANGTVKSHQKISSTEGGFTGILDRGVNFGIDVAPIGDLNEDGVDDLVITSIHDDDGGLDRGAIWIIFMNADGTVSSHQKISSTEGGFDGPLDDDDHFGHAAAVVGDLDGDGIQDLAIGGARDDDGGFDQGAVWVLFLNRNGTVKGQQKISETTGGFTGTLDIDDRFGRGIAAIGDLNGDGAQDIAVGAFRDDDAGQDRGAVYVLFLEDIITPIEAPPVGSPSTHVLEAAHPNPFTVESAFQFSVAEPQFVHVDLVSSLGRVVSTLFAGNVAADETRTVSIDSAGLPSGTYVIRLVGETFSDGLMVTVLR